MAGFLDNQSDLGLLGGVAEGFKQGMVAYQDAKKRQQDLALQKQKLDLESADRKEQQDWHKQQTEIDLASKGLLRTDKGLIENPESSVVKERAAKATAYGAKKGFILKKDTETGEEQFVPDLSQQQKKQPLISKDAAGLRKEFNARPEVKSFREIGIQSSKVDKAAKDPSAAGDLSLIFAFMKLLDPGSTVREGEFATAAQATGVPGQVLNQYNKIKSGERLTPQQRQDFIKQAKGLAASHQAAYDAAKAEYTDHARSYGVDPKVVIGLPVSKPMEEAPEQRVVNGVTYIRKEGAWHKQ